MSERSEWIERAELAKTVRQQRALAAQQAEACERQRRLTRLRARAEQARNLRRRCANAHDLDRLYFAPHLLDGAISWPDPICGARLTQSCRAVFGFVLACHLQGLAGLHASTDTIAGELAMSASTVRRSLARLELYQLVHRVPQHDRSLPAGRTQLANAVRLGVVGMAMEAQVRARLDRRVESPKPEPPAPSQSPPRRRTSSKGQSKCLPNAEETLFQPDATASAQISPPHTAHAAPDANLSTVSTLNDAIQAVSDGPLRDQIARLALHFPPSPAAAATTAAEKRHVEQVMNS